MFAVCTSTSTISRTSSESDVGVCEVIKMGVETGLSQRLSNVGGMPTSEWIKGHASPLLHVP